MTKIDPTQMSNRELLRATVTAAGHERRATAELLTLLAEVDARQLYLGEGCSSLFTYCTQVLHLSEHAAYHRIEAARTARRYPVIIDLVANGDVTITTVALLRPHLTPENHEALLSAARHKSKRDVEYQIACLAPKPLARALIRRLPERQPSRVQTSDDVGTAIAEVPSATATLLLTPTVSGVSASPAVARTRPTIAPLASDSYLLRVTLSASAHGHLRRAQELMRHSLPSGDPAAIVERALAALVDQLEETKSAKTSKPRRISMTCAEPSSNLRHIPAPVKRAVWARDQGRCAFVGSHGRCTEIGHLEYHHVIPFAHGGVTDVGNIALRCRAHNVFESELVFGRWAPPPEQPASRIDDRSSKVSTRSGPS